MTNASAANDFSSSTRTTTKTTVSTISRTLSAGCGGVGRLAAAADLRCLLGRQAERVDEERVKKKPTHAGRRRRDEPEGTCPAAPGDQQSGGRNPVRRQCTPPRKRRSRTPGVSARLAAVRDRRAAGPGGAAVRSYTDGRLRRRERGGGRGSGGDDGLLSSAMRTP